MEYKYEIDGKTYIQKKLVLGQLKQLMNILKYFQIPAGVPNLNIAIALALGDKLPEAIAIVLIEEGKTPKQMADPETRAALVAEIEDQVDLEKAVGIIQDFFVCNPIASISKKLEATKKMLAGIIKETKPAGSTNSSSPSAEETSPGATESSGDSPSTSASPS